MGIYLKKLLLAILCIGNISYASAQLDSNITDSQNVTPLKPHFFNKIIIPTVLIGYGALSLGSGDLRQLDRYINNSTIGQHGYSGSADDYLRYGPIAVVYGLDLIGIKSKNKLIDRSLMLAMSMAFTSTAVTFTKHNSHRERPDGSSFTSFPSSHTAMAFMGAEFMHQEYGEKSIWFSVIGYGTATATGILRLYHHVHWFSDVTMGAGYGILATKLSYILYPHLKNFILRYRSSNLDLKPTFVNSRPGFTMKLKLQ